MSKKRKFDLKEDRIVVVDGEGGQSNKREHFF
jgi:hypothetical protein